MTQEDKQLLLKDLSARLLYGVKVQLSDEGDKLTQTLYSITPTKVNSWSIEQVDVKPYLRPMSSMTKEERIDSLNYAWKDDYGRLASYNENIPKYINWLNAHHFDYNGLIEKGLAIKVTKENNPYKE